MEFYTSKLFIVFAAFPKNRRNSISTLRRPGTDVARARGSLAFGANQQGYTPACVSRLCVHLWQPTDQGQNGHVHAIPRHVRRQKGGKAAAINRRKAPRYLGNIVPGFRGPRYLCPPAITERAPKNIRVIFPREKMSPAYSGSLFPPLSAGRSNSGHPRKYTARNL